MKQTLIALLETLGFPVYLQGSIAAPEDYPDSFFTFWVFSAPESQDYDNAAHRCVWGFWVYFYSTDPMQVLEYPERARQLLKENGFVTEGKAVDVRVDTPTHTGAMITVYGVENYHKEETANEHSDE